MRLVANGTTGRAESASVTDEAGSFHHERSRLTSDMKSEDLFERQKDIDYLDIPAFLRTQADLAGPVSRPLIIGPGRQEPVGLPCTLHSACPTPAMMSGNRKTETRRCGPSSGWCFPVAGRGP